MIANAYLNEWRQTVRWSDNKMVEQDLVNKVFFAYRRKILISGGD